MAKATEQETGSVGPRAVLWDVDGTLVDSTEYHFETWREALAREDFRLTREDFLRSFGKRNDAVVRALLSDVIASSEIERISETKEARYRELVRERGIALLPGVGVWLRRLMADGWLQALASSAPPANLDAILAATNLTNFFDTVVSAEQVEHGKPDPQIFLLAAEKLGVASRRCVVVEDAPAGVEAGRRAGMKTVGVLTSHTSLAADVVARRLDELPDHVFDELVARVGPSNALSTP